MPDEDNNVGGSLVLDFRKWWRQVQPKNNNAWSQVMQNARTMYNLGKMRQGTLRPLKNTLTDHACKFTKKSGQKLM